MKKQLDDGFGNKWEGCGHDDCALEIVRPGVARCERCEYVSHCALPCVCGGKVYIRQRADHRGWWITCGKCGVTTYRTMSLDAAIAAWNEGRSFLPKRRAVAPNAERNGERSESDCRAVLGNGGEER